MVLGRLRPRRRRKGRSLSVDYLIHVKQIYPWTSTMSQRTVESVWLQWENGDKSCGFFTANVMEGKIEFNESFTLSVTLINESKKGSNTESFRKNQLEFHLYECRKDKSAKGHHLGSAFINLADYGIVEETVSVNSQINVRKSSKNMMPPVIYFVIQRVNKRSGSLSPKGSRPKGVSVDLDSELVSDNDEEDSDDDGAPPPQPPPPQTQQQSSHSSSYFSFEAAKNIIHLTNQLQKRRTSSTRENKETSNVEPPQHSKAGISNSDENKPKASSEVQNKTELEKGSKNTVNKEPPNSEQNSVAEPYKSQNAKAAANSEDPSTESSKSQINNKDQSGSESAKDNTNRAHGESVSESFRPSAQQSNRDRATGSVAAKEESSTDLNKKKLEPQNKGPEEHKTEIKDRSLEEDTSKRVKFGQSKDKDLRVRAKEANIPEDTSSGSVSPTVTETKGLKNVFIDSKDEMKYKIEMLEEELRETAAMEVALYSVVAEHGNSVSKVHAPARRLSRFFLHACKGRSSAKRASASRTCIAGLILVSRACGNDVPRLAFWLSNAIVLRATISQACADLSGFSESDNDVKKFSPRSHNSSSNKDKNDAKECLEDWGNIQTLRAELEKVEAWIFSRIVESVWWQTLTPHMQPAAAKNSKADGKILAYGDPEQVNFSTDLWKSAFKDARERLCPLRAVGLECGCLTVLARLVMEQLVNRLDVAMFNAILRDSDEDMPTDPMSDPISDSNVLPVPGGKTSFGAGAQLKSCIGEWSRWLTDLFGIDEDPSETGLEKRQETAPPFKPFYLLNSLCDLLMLPFNMISDQTSRQEVCPSFSTALVRTVFINFVPDEFCPDKVPKEVFEALDAEALPEADYISSVPCNAAPIVYTPPRATSLASIIEVGNDSPSARRCPVLRKSYTSDDELDELDSPLKSISIDNILGKPSSQTLETPKKKKGPKAVRYQLLREVWKDEN